MIGASFDVAAVAPDVAQEGVERFDLVGFRQRLGIAERGALRQFDPVHAVKAHRVREPARQRAIDAIRFARGQAPRSSAGG